MLTAKDIMTKEVIVAQEDFLVKDLAKILAENRISGVPVINDEGEVIGVVTENDLIDQTKKVHIPTVVTILDSILYLENPARLAKDLAKMAGARVGEICSRNFIKVDKETPLDEIATIMSEKKVHTLPVMEEKKLVGIIGKSDIIRTLAQG